MIKLIRTVRAEKPTEACQLAVKLTNYIKTNHNPNAIEVFVDRFAQNGHSIHWHIDFDNLAAFEKWQESLIDDQGYRGLLAEAEADKLFDPVTMCDLIQQRVDIALSSRTLN